MSVYTHVHVNKIKYNHKNNITTIVCVAHGCICIRTCKVIYQCSALIHLLNVNNAYKPLCTFACDNVKPFSQNYIKWLFKVHFVVLHNFLLCGQWSFHITSRSASHRPSPPLLCHVILCDVTGLAEDPTYIKGVCLLPRSSYCFLQFVHSSSSSVLKVAASHLSTGCPA